jgi:uncharacterized protein YfaP (DUF2135 family)
MRKLAAVLSVLALTVTLGACAEKEAGQASPSNGSSGGGSEQAATNLAALAQSIGEKTGEKTSAHMTMDMSVAEQTISAEGDMEFGANDVAMTMTMEIPGQGEMTMLLSEGVMYIQMPQELEPGKPWIKIDPKGDDPMSKALGSTFDDVRKNADPRASIEQLKDSGEITAEEEVELNGEQTTHYSITVDVEKMAAQQDDPAAKTALEAAGVKDFPAELWVNGDGLPMRMTMDMPMADPTSGKAMNAKLQMDYTDWGKAVEIAVPSPDQIAELPGS